MKKMLTSTAMTGLAILIVTVLGCASTKVQHVSGANFLKHAEGTAQYGSFAWTSYIGSTHDRAYLEFGHPAFIGSGNQVTVFWTLLSELPSNIVGQINAGARPWTNAMDRFAEPTAPGYRH